MISSKIEIKELIFRRSDNPSYIDNCNYLCPIIGNPSTSVNLLDICLKSSVAANRWDALQDLHNNLFMKWNEETIKPCMTYIHENKETFLRYAESINVIIPQIIKACF